MNTTIVYEELLPHVDDYWDLFNTTDWNEKYHFTKEELQKAITNSWYAVSAYEDKKLVGFGRIIADGTHHAFIVDMIVHTDYQGRGIGATVLDKLVKKCLESKIRDIQLFAAEDKYGFYEKYNFEKRPENAPGMRYKREEIDRLKKAGWHF